MKRNNIIEPPSLSFYNTAGRSQFSLIISSNKPLKSTTLSHLYSTVSPPSLSVTQLNLEKNLLAPRILSLLIFLRSLLPKILSKLILINLSFSSVYLNLLLISLKFTLRWLVPNKLIPFFKLEWSGQTPPYLKIPQF